MGLARTFVIRLKVSTIFKKKKKKKSGCIFLNEIIWFQTGADIEKDEVNIISGALQLRKKTVMSVMTKLEDVYMLSYDSVLDFETVSEIMNSGE